MAGLFWLLNEAWIAIEPHLPNNQPGVQQVDDPRTISGDFHVLKSGCRWATARRPTARRRRFTIASIRGLREASG